MISTNARDGFDNLLIRSLKSSAAAQLDVVCDVNIEPDLSAVHDTKCVVLTVSSYLFRLMVLIYFTPNATTKMHFSRLDSAAAEEMSAAALNDAVSEFANMCCGALSRDLLVVFPHIGMSTPNIIDKECSLSLDQLKCGHIQHFKLNVNADTHIFASLCVSDYADLDFVIDTTCEEVSGGELELF